MCTTLYVGLKQGYKPLPTVNISEYIGKALKLRGFFGIMDRSYQHICLPGCMQKGLEKLGHETEEQKNEKDKGEKKDMKPSAKTVDERKDVQEKITGIREEEERERVKEDFLARADGLKQEYKDYKVKVGENEFVLNLKDLSKDGEVVKDVNKIKAEVQNGLGLEHLGGTFMCNESKSGITIGLNLPIRVILSGEGIKERLKNDFSGGMMEYYKGVEEKNAAAQAQKPENKDKSAEQERQKQMAEVKKAGEKAGGGATVIEGRNFSSVIISYKNNKQLHVISSPDMAVFQVVEVDDGKMTSSKTTKKPLDLILPAESEGK